MPPCPCGGGSVIGPTHDLDCPVGLDAALHVAMRREEAVYGLNRRIGLGLHLAVDA